MPRRYRPGTAGDRVPLAVPAPSQREPAPGHRRVALAHVRAVARRHVLEDVEHGGAQRLGDIVLARGEQGRHDAAERVAPGAAHLGREPPGGGAIDVGTAPEHQSADHRATRGGVAVSVGARVAVDRHGCRIVARHAIAELECMRALEPGRGPARRRSRGLAGLRGRRRPGLRRVTATRRGHQDPHQTP